MSTLPFLIVAVLLLGLLLLDRARERAQQEALVLRPPAECWYPVFKPALVHADELP